MYTPVKPGFFPLFILFLPLSIFSQQKTLLPAGGGNYAGIAPLRDEITAAQRKQIILMLQENEKLLLKKGRLPKAQNTLATLFEWPLRQASGYHDRGFYSIGNYIDHNPAFPNQISDYNCGTRSYDLSSGYNHKGTDIGLWPFGWTKMEQNVVEIVSGAPGIIIGKSDGNFDKNCSFCTTPCDWNAVYIRHSDGSVAWYGHMKSGSLTTKQVGQPVVTGEYLGIVGSSGNSTGPHLHLEIYADNNYTQLVDPWAGPCNLLNGNTSWWANQQNYYEPTLCRIMTNSDAPVLSSCPGGENEKEKINYRSGQALYLSSYYRDQQAGQRAVHTIYRPDNSIFFSWLQDFTANYTSSYWYYIFGLPDPAPSGLWKYEVDYLGAKTNSFFVVNSGTLSLCPGFIKSLHANVSATSYKWQVNTGNGFTNISDNTIYSGTDSAVLKLNNVPSSFYGNQYRCILNGNIPGEILTLKFASRWEGTKNNRWEEPENWSCGRVPDENTDVVIPAATPFGPVVGSNVACRSAQVNNGAAIKVLSGFNLSILK